MPRKVKYGKVVFGRPLVCIMITDEDPTWWTLKEWLRLVK